MKASVDLINFSPATVLNDDVPNRVWTRKMYLMIISECLATRLMFIFLG